MAQKCSEVRRTNKVLQVTTRKRRAVARGTRTPTLGLAMETIEEAKVVIAKELASDDTEVRAEFLKRFSAEIERFAEAMAKAFVNWRSLDDGVKGNEKRAYVSAWVYTAVTLHILSMKLLLSGHLVASGNLYRQVIETMALALVCSGKELNVLDRFVEGKYSTNDAVSDMIRHAEKLSVNKDAVKVLESVQKFNHKYSHPSVMTIASGMAFGNKGLYVGAAFDEEKMEAYSKEVGSRRSCAEVFSNFIDGVKANVAKW